MEDINRILTQKQHDFETPMCHGTELSQVLWTLFWISLRIEFVYLWCYYFPRSTGVHYINAAEQLRIVWSSLFCKNILVPLSVLSRLPLYVNLSCSKVALWKRACIWICPKVTNGLWSSEACGAKTHLQRSILRVEESLLSHKKWYLQSQTASVKGSASVWILHFPALPVLTADC